MEIMMLAPSIPSRPHACVRDFNLNAFNLASNKLKVQGTASQSDMSGNVAFRDLSVVVIETGRTTIRAILGLAELLKLPAIEIDARVGLRQTAESSTRPETHVNDYLVGHKLDEALEAGEDVIVSWPFRYGDIKDWAAAEAIWYVQRFLGAFSLRLTNGSPRNTGNISCPTAFS